jgi:hypothetical protein
MFIFGRVSPQSEAFGAAEAPNSPPLISIGLILATVFPQSSDAGWLGYCGEDVSQPPPPSPPATLSGSFIFGVVFAKSSGFGGGGAGLSFELLTSEKAPALRNKL